MKDKHVEDLKEFAIERPTGLIDDKTEQKQVNVTSCKRCVFSINEETKNKKKTKQTGCKLGRIEKYRKKGVYVIEACDEEAEFYGIETWCNGYREEPWEIAHRGEDLTVVARLESSPKVNFIILVEDTMDNLEKTIEPILNQDKIKACRIVVVLMGKGANYFALIEKCKDLLEGQIDYKVQNTGSHLSQLEAIDESFKNLLSGYYSVVECGKEVPRDLIDTLNINLYDKLIDIGLVKGYDGINGLTVQCVLHKFLYGNKGASLEIKLKEGEEHDRETYIRERNIQPKKERRSLKPESPLIKTWDELR